MFTASNTVRMLFFNATIIIMIGIGLSGFEKVHWFSYVLPTFLLFAAATGLCPGLMVSKKMLAILGIKE